VASAAFLRPGAVCAIMSSIATLQAWEHGLERLLADYKYRVGYGNLRAQRSQWDRDGEVINFALVYELPGGSTSQVNIEYHSGEDCFRFLAPESTEEQCSREAEAVLSMVRDTIARIPARRMQRLREDINRWFGQGKSSHDMFLEINKLLQTDFKGGSLTHQELKAGVNYILELGKQNRAG